MTATGKGHGLGKSILVILHNVLSIQRVVEMAKVVYGMGFDTLIVSKAAGAAAQTGVPEAQRIALKKGKNFLYLSDLPDVIELFSPKLIYLFVPKGYSVGEFSPEEVLKEVEGGNKVALIFGGLDPGLSRKELELGRAVSLPCIGSDIGPIGSAAIALYEVRRYMNRRRG